VPEGFRFEFIRPRPSPTKLKASGSSTSGGRWVECNPKTSGLGDLQFRNGQRKFQVAFSTITDFIDEPDLQFTKFVSSDKSPLSYGRYTDRILDDLYIKQGQTTDPVERKKLCTLFQKRVLDEMAYSYPVLGWTGRITMLSPKLKGGKHPPAM